MERETIETLEPFEIIPRMTNWRVAGLSLQFAMKMHKRVRIPSGGPCPCRLIG